MRTIYNEDCADYLFIDDRVTVSVMAVIIARFALVRCSLRSSNFIIVCPISGDQRVNVHSDASVNKDVTDHRSFISLLILNLRLWRCLSITFRWLT